MNYRKQPYEKSNMKGVTPYEGERLEQEIQRYLSNEEASYNLKSKIILS